MERNRVLIPLDGSDASLRIFRHIRKFLGPEANELILFRVSVEPAGWAASEERPVAVGLDGSIYPAGGKPEPRQHQIYATQEEESRKAALQNELKDELRALQAEGYTVSAEVRFGNPADEIVGFAAANRIDLIAMTTHGRTGVKRLIAGSVAEEIVRRVGLPLLVLRPF